MSPKAEDFRNELRRLLAKAEEFGFIAVDVNSGNLHRRVGCYPGADHRMPVCCKVMYDEMTERDQRISQPESAQRAPVF